MPEVGWHFAARNCTWHGKKISLPFGTPPLPELSWRSCPGNIRPIHQPRISLSRRINITHSGVLSRWTCPRRRQNGERAEARTHVDEVSRWRDTRPANGISSIKTQKVLSYAYQRNLVCLSLGTREAPGHPDIRSECRRTILAPVQPFPAKGCRPRNTPAFGFIVIIVSNCQHAGYPEICRCLGFHPDENNSRFYSDEEAGGLRLIKDDFCGFGGRLLIPWIFGKYWD